MDNIGEVENIINKATMDASKMLPIVKNSCSDGVNCKKNEFMKHHKKFWKHGKAYT